MAIAGVQRVAKGTNGASVSIGAADGWSAPTTGNLLVISANSDALVTLSGAGTVLNGPSIIDGNGTYTWYKTATGAETTITGTPSVSDHITLTVCEYSGTDASLFDAQNSSTVSAGGAFVTVAASVSSTAAADLIVGFALIHSYAGAQPATPSWSNSFASALSGNSGGLTSAATTTFVGELLPAGAAGSYSTVCTWTAATASDRQHIILAFKAAAGAPPAGPVTPKIYAQAVGLAANW